MNADEETGLSESERLEQEAREAERRAEARSSRARVHGSRDAGKAAAKAMAKRKSMQDAPSVVAFSLLRWIVPASILLLAGHVSTCEHGASLDIFPPLWAALLGVSAVALAWVGTWRRRLGYEVEGLDHIGGSWQQNHREGPFIACRVVIKMRDGATESEQRAVVAALKILVATVNEDLESDKDCRDAKRWTFVSESVVEGEGTLGLYRTGMLRRWLSGPMRRAVIAGGVIGVSVNARYTGESFRIK